MAPTPRRQLALLRAEPDRLPVVVEELLRFAGPLQVTMPSVTTEPVSHLVFGHGIHHCLGAPLARLEGKIALRTLLSCYPRLRLAVPPHELTWQPSLLLHGLTMSPRTQS